MKRAMNNSRLASMALAAAAALIFAPAPASAQQEPKADAAAAPKAASLTELLERVKAGYRQESTELKERERRFEQEASSREKLRNQALAELAAAEKRAQELEKQFELQEKEIAGLQESLRIRLGNMGELFGVVREVAGDSHSQMYNSLLTAQYPDRLAPLAKLAESKELPSMKELEQLWFTLQQEMIESGRVQRFKAPVVAADGKEAELPVVRVGPFNAVANDRYLVWMPEVQKLAELARQPADMYVDTLSNLNGAKTPFVEVAVDPSRGTLLSLLVQTPDFNERLGQGGTVGYTILVLGVLGFLLAVIRLLTLAWTSTKVARQRQSKTISTDNPLGRVLKVYEDNPDLSPEALELKLDEAVVREAGKIESLVWVVKVISVVAPLMGLLGTVTGMIQTFQAITLFGTGDPKLMASGISEALVTTMEGLVVAIPLVLMHSWLSSTSRRLISLLTEQSVGMVAQRAEGEQKRASAA